MAGFFDGLKNIVSTLANSRNGMAQNVFESDRLPYDQMRAIVKTGLGSKIVRLKAGYAFADTVDFSSNTDHDYWHKHVEKHVIKATRHMLAYGRGIIVLHHLGDDLTMPLEYVDRDSVILSVFSGDMVSSANTSYDIQNERYMKPLTYVVRGYSIHWTRVIDFTYVEPPELEAPQYLFGGISEFELIRGQLINDGIIERASSSIIEKSSNFIYKVKGFADALRAGQDDQLIQYFTQIENMRSIYGAVVLDSDDDATSVSQQLSNLSEINEMSLRRLAMVTGIPVAFLVGESVRGLNSTGENEHLALIDTVKHLQVNYLSQPLYELFEKLDMGEWKWSEDQGVTDKDRVEFEQQIIQNAQMLAMMGEDGSAYLVSKGLTKEENWDTYWTNGGQELEEQVNEHKL